MAALGSVTDNEEAFPSFPSTGSRSAGGVAPALYREAYVAANAVNPASTAADIVLAVYSIPAGFFNVKAQAIGPAGSPIAAAGPGLEILIAGLFAATANNKTIKIIFNPSAAIVGSAVVGGTTIASSGVVAINALGFNIQAKVIKVGLPNSNTQIAFQTDNVVGATQVSPPVPVYPTAVENAAILLAITGNAATATTDIGLSYFEVLGIH